MSPRPFRLAAVLSAALLLSACGGDDDEDSGKPAFTTLRAESGLFRDAPGFSPDGSRIAFFRRPLQGGTDELAVMNADGTDVRVLTALEDGAFGDTAWSPDGSRIHYTDDGSLYSIPATGGTPTLEYDAFCAHELDVAPDGRSVVYATCDRALHVLDLATRTSVEVLDGGEAPAFSPDGTRVAYLHRPDFDSGQIRVLTLATKQSTLVTNEADYLASADWLPDGRLAAITNDGITLFDLAGAAPQGRLVRDEFAAKSLDVSPDGKKMVYAINGQADLFVLSGF
jgi:Tol biopolymer transport system component